MEAALVELAKGAVTSPAAGAVLVFGGMLWFTLKRRMTKRLSDEIVLLAGAAIIAACIWKMLT